MELSKYQIEQGRTVNRREDKDSEMVEAVVGLIGEIGEVVDIVKKHVFHFHDLRYDKLDEEMGDVLWYITYVCSLFRIDVADCGLRDRHGFDGRGSNGDALKNPDRLPMGTVRVFMMLSKDASAITEEYLTCHQEGRLIDKGKMEWNLTRLMATYLECCDLVGLRVCDIARNNVEKLRKRYPGKFSAERSINREN